MKKVLIFSIFLTVSFICFGQNSDPYKLFGHISKVKYEATDKIAFSELLYIKNKDTSSITKAVAFDMGSGFAFQLGVNDTILDKIKIEPEQIFRWLSVDPLASKYPQWSPYAAMGDDPIRKIDPDGRKFVNFDDKGNYTNTTKDNWWHNLWHGSQGRVLNGAGDVQQKFRFADPKHDVADIQNGIIKRIEFVKESDISNMVSNAGGFTHDNKTANRSWGDRYSYIMKEGQGGGKMDFSYTAIPQKYAGASRDPLNSPSPMIFLVDGVAHNHMNFGNFLFGATGQAMGFTALELSLGAHYNSVKNSDKNGYSPQLDSDDDQYSIQLGFNHGNNNNYLQKEWKVIVGPLQ